MQFTITTTTTAAATMQPRNSGIGLIGSGSFLVLPGAMPVQEWCQNHQRYGWFKLPGRSIIDPGNGVMINVYLYQIKINYSQEIMVIDPMLCWQVNLIYRKLVLSLDSLV